MRILPAGTLAMDPTPAPGSSRIAFVVANYVDGTGDIFVVNTYDGQVRQLTTDSELDDSPAWSPDGSRIAFRSYRSGNDGEIWVMNADGSDPVNLTPNAPPATWDNRRPSWSPDGRSITWASTLGGDWGIWVMSADGTGKRQLTNTIDLDAEPVWSPDGSSIAFRRSESGGETDIFVVPASGGEAVRLPMAGVQRQPAWSQGGASLYFVSQASLAAQPEIWIMARDGTNARRLTKPAWGGAIEPAWVLHR